MIMLWSRREVRKCFIDERPLGDVGGVQEVKIPGKQESWEVSRGELERLVGYSRLFLAHMNLEEPILYCSRRFWCKCQSSNRYSLGEGEGGAYRVAEAIMCCSAKP